MPQKSTPARASRESEAGKAKRPGIANSAAREKHSASAIPRHTEDVPAQPRRSLSGEMKLIAIFALIAALFLILVLTVKKGKGNAGESKAVLPAPTAAVTAAVTEDLRPTFSCEPTAEPQPAYMTVQASPAAAAQPSHSQWKYQSGIYINGARTYEYTAPEAIYFDEGNAYTKLEGIITYRGSNFRQNSAYGTAALTRKEFQQIWKRSIGMIDSGYTTWSGVGWTGQPVIVKWPEELRAVMNINSEFKNDSELVEVIYGTLDGNIYFLDLRTGHPTRSPIILGFPIKGSVSVDPRGYPLLYVGQGISIANGVKGSIGWHVYSLLDQREIYFLDGRDKLAFREHGSFDGTCIINAEADTAIMGGENGILYLVRLNSAFDISVPSISVQPQVTAYRYKSSATAEQGMENSVAAYGKYIWFADNGGLLTCMDVNTLQAVWLFNMGDDVDSTITLEAEKDGSLALYTVNQVDKQGAQGTCSIYKLNALTGDVLWRYSVFCTSDGTNGGGGFASPAIGQYSLAEYVYFNICYTSESGTLYCLRKRSGEVVWSKSTTTPSWSSPNLVYREDGTAVLVVGNCGGRGVIGMYDPLTGKRLSKINLEGKIECTPAIFNDIMVVGTRECKMYGIKLQ